MISAHLKFVRARILVLVVVHIIIVIGTGRAQTIVQPLLYVNSPRAVAMGGCSVDLVGAESPLYNPAGLGLFHLDYILSLQLPNSTKWLPEVTSDLRLKSWGFSIGDSYRVGKSKDPAPLKIAAGLAYSQLRMDYGKVVVTNDGGYVIGSIEPYDKADNFSAGVGVELLQVLRLGAGYTYKRITSRLAQQGAGLDYGSATASANVHDYGIIAQAHLHTLVPHQMAVGQSGRYYAHVELTPSYAYVKANIGDSLAYIDAAQADLQPRISRRGPSLYTAVDINQSVLASFRWTGETETDLFNKITAAKKHGYEFGTLGIVYYRGGKLEDLGAGSNFDTHGFGLSSAGLVSWLKTLGKLHTGGSTIVRLVSSLDITFDYAVWHSENNAMDNTKFYKLTVSMIR